MAVYYKTKGFVLNKIDRNEADRLYIVYTKDFGKIEVLGRAIRKIKSKLRSGIDIFYLSEVEFIQGKIYKTLTDALLNERFINIRRSLNKLEIAKKISEAVDDFTTKEGKDEEIFNLLNIVFNKLNTIKEDNENKLEIIYYYFIWNLLSILGYEIDLYRCVICNRMLPVLKLYFSPEEGGIICPIHMNLRQKMDISPDIIKILRIILRNNLNTLLRVKITRQHINEIKLISDAYFYFYKP